MDQLNYVPNASAANLARRFSKNVLYADRFYKGLPYENPHMFDIICGVSHELGRKGYRLSLLNMDSPGKKPEEVLEEAIHSRVADGLIINSVFVVPKVERLLLWHDFPQICIGKPPFDTILSWIDTNNTLSSNLAVEHLISTGCHTLAFMGGQKEDIIFMDRLRGFRTAMERCGFETREEYITYNPPEVEAIFQSATALLKLPSPPDGIICTNSLMAVGTVRAIKESGLRIPEDGALKLQAAFAALQGIRLLFQAGVYSPAIITADHSLCYAHVLIILSVIIGLPAHHHIHNIQTHAYTHTRLGI